MSETDFEILSVVDSRDRVIGQRTRKEIHQLGLLHRAVHVLLHNQKGQFFLQHRAFSKDINPGLWDSSAAGHVNAGEIYHDCAVREVQEELGIDAEGRLHKLFKLSARPETGMEFCTVYSLSDDGPFNLNEDEIQGGKWVAKKELDQWLEGGGVGLTRIFQLIWLRVRDKLEPPNSFW